MRWSKWSSWTVCPEQLPQSIKSQFDASVKMVSQNSRIHLQTVFMKASEKHGAALNLVSLSTIWDTGSSLRYTISNLIHSLNLTFSAQKRNWRVSWGILDALHKMHPFQCLLDILNVPLLDSSGRARITSLKSFAEEWWENYISNLTSCKRAKRMSGGSHL